MIEAFHRRSALRTEMHRSTLVKEPLIEHYLADLLESREKLTHQDGTTKVVLVELQESLPAYMSKGEGMCSPWFLQRLMLDEFNAQEVNTVS